MENKHFDRSLVNEMFDTLEPVAPQTDANSNLTPTGVMIINWLG